MTEQELARALMQSGRINQEHVQYAVQQRTPTKGFAQVLVDLGWVSREEILEIDPHAFDPIQTAQTAPVNAVPPVSLAPPETPFATPSPTMPTQTPPPDGASTYGGTAATSRGTSTVAPTAQVRFAAIGEAWSLFSAQMGVWIPATLLYFIVTVVLSNVIGFVVGAVLGGRIDPTRIDPNNPFAALAGAIPAITVSFYLQWVLSTFFTGGLYRIALKQLRGEPTGIGDAFNIGDVFGSLLTASFVVAAAEMIGFMACILPMFVVGGLLMLTVPLIMDKRLVGMEAVGQSWNALKGSLFAASAFYFCAALIGGIGLFLCLIGVLFTWPIFILATAIVYRDFFPDSSDFRQPGTPPGSYPPPPIPTVP